MSLLDRPETVTVAWVQTVIGNIRLCAGDDEIAHGMEDDLRAIVLRSIADGTCTDPTECAAATLESDKLDFQRWCA